MDYNRDLKIVRTKDNTYPLPYKNNVIWIHHDKSKEPIAEVWDHGKWVPLTGALAGSAVIGDIPEGVKTNGTSKEFFQSLLDEYNNGNIGLNGFFQGQVEMSDLPGNLGNGEATIQVIRGLNGEPIFNVELTTTSYDDTHLPYRWDYSSRRGGFDKWIPRATGDTAGSGEVFDTIYTDGSDESKAANMVILEKLGTTNSAPVIVDNKVGQKIIGNFYNGSITTLVDDALHVIDISFETGDITTTADIDISKIEEYTHLEVGNSAEVKSFNLEQLKTGPQMVSIDYGFGVANWNSSTGGGAHITTAQGVEVYYTIGVDGTVAKSGEIGKDSVWQKLTTEQTQLLDDIYENVEIVLTEEQVNILNSFPHYFQYALPIDNSPLIHFFKNELSIISAPVSGDKEVGSFAIEINNNKCLFRTILYAESATKKETNATNISILDNTEYNISKVVSTLTITISDIQETFNSECVIYFKTGTTAPTITLPDSVKWANNDVPSFKANKAYELNFRCIHFADTITLIGAYAEYTV